MKNMLFVFLGGGFGSVLRYAIGLVVPNQSGFPVSTFLVNVLGSFLMGILTAIFIKDRQHISETLMPLLAIGFCGGFTTFSAFSRETFLLIQQSNYGMLLFYAVLSIFLCIAAMALGYILIK